MKRSKIKKPSRTISRKSAVKKKSPPSSRIPASESAVKNPEVRWLIKELERLPEILAAKKAKRQAELRFAYDVFGDAVKQALGKNYPIKLERTLGIRKPRGKAKSRKKRT